MNERQIKYNEQIEQYLRKNAFRHFCPKAVLFDMDGVLYDSMPAHAYSWHTAMGHFNIEMSEEEAYMYEGMRGVETIKHVVRDRNGVQISDEVSERMYAEKSRIFATRPEAKLMEGIIELHQLLRDRGMKIVVVTGSGQHSLLAKLKRDFHGLVEPQLVVSALDVTIGKPNPMPYLVGMEKAEVKPWEAVVVENAPLGVRAAVAAKIFTIAVNTGPLPDKLLTDEGANLIFPSIKQLLEEMKRNERNL